MMGVGEVAIRADRSFIPLVACTLTHPAAGRPRAE